MISLCPHLIHDYFGKVEEIFKVYHPQIVEQVEYQDISDGLTLRGVISPKQHDQIHLIEDNKDQMEKAITTIQRRIWGLENFVMVLMDENLNPWLAEELFQSYTRYLVPHVKKQRSLGKCDCPAESTYLGSLNKRWISMLRKMDSWIFEVGTSIGFLNQSLYPTGSLLSFISDRLPLPEKNPTSSGDLELQYKQIMCSPRPTQNFENYRLRSPVTVLEVADKDELENGFEDDNKERTETTSIPLVRSASMNSIVSVSDSIQNDKPTKGRRMSTSVITNDADRREDWSDDFGNQPQSSKAASQYAFVVENNLSGSRLTAKNSSNAPCIKPDLLNNNGCNSKELFSMPSTSVKETESTNLMNNTASYRNQSQQSTDFSNNCENGSQQGEFYEKSFTVSGNSLFLESDTPKSKSSKVFAEGSNGIHNEDHRPLNIDPSDADPQKSLEHSIPEYYATKCTSNQSYSSESDPTGNHLIESHLSEFSPIKNKSEIKHASKVDAIENQPKEHHSDDFNPTCHPSVEIQLAEPGSKKIQSLDSTSKSNPNQTQSSEDQLAKYASVKNETTNYCLTESDPVSNYSNEGSTDGFLPDSDLTSTMQLENDRSKSNKNKNQNIEGHSDQLIQTASVEHLSMEPESYSTESDPSRNQAIDGCYVSESNQTIKNRSIKNCLPESNQIRNQSVGARNLTEIDASETENMNQRVIESDSAIRQVSDSSYSDSDYTKKSSESQSKDLYQTKYQSVEDYVSESELTEKQLTQHHLASDLVSSNVSPIRNHSTKSSQNASVKNSCEEFGPANFLPLKNVPANYDLTGSKSSESFSTTPKLVKSKFTVDNLAECTELDLEGAKHLESFSSEINLVTNDSTSLFRTESDPNLMLSLPEEFNTAERLSCKVGNLTVSRKVKSKSEEFDSAVLQADLTRTKETHNFSKNSAEPRSCSRERFSIDSPHQSNSKLIQPYSEDYNLAEDEEVIAFNFGNPMQYYNLASSDQEIILPMAKTFKKANLSSNSDNNRIGRSASAISSSACTAPQQVKTSDLTNALDLAVPQGNDFDHIVENEDGLPLKFTEDNEFNLESASQSLEFLTALDTTQASYIPSELEWDWDYDTAELDITLPKIEMADSETQTCNFLSSSTNEETNPLSLEGINKTLFSNAETSSVSKNQESQDGGESQKSEEPYEHGPQEPNELHEPQEPSELHEPQEPSELHEPHKTNELHEPQEPRELHEPQNPSELHGPQEPNVLHEPQEPNVLHEPQEPNVLHEPQEPNELHEPKKTNELHEPQESSKLHEPKQSKEKEPKPVTLRQEIRKSQDMKSRSSLGSASSLSSVKTPKSSTPLPSSIRKDKSKPVVQLPFSSLTRISSPKSKDKTAKPVSLSPATSIKSKLSKEKISKSTSASEKTQQLESAENGSKKDKETSPKKGTVRSFLKNKLLPSATTKKEQKTPPPFSNSADKERLSPADYGRQQWTIEWASRQDKKRNSNNS